jgi:hypothetical protein
MVCELGFADAVDVINSVIDSRLSGLHARSSLSLVFGTAD